MWTDRTELLIGKENVEVLKSKHVAVVGIGGVGGYVCTMLARAGIGKMTIIDFDVVDETNINRQVVANVSSVGQQKTTVMKKMIEEINPECVVNVKQERICKENMSTLLNEPYDYVVDAIDSVKDKIELICYCKEKALNIISAMGAGNRIDIPNFEVMDIFKTSYDGLAKVVRKQLRERKIENLDVVTSRSQSIAIKENKIGSISYYPAMCGCVLSAFVINKFIGRI